MTQKITGHGDRFFDQSEGLKACTSNHEILNPDMDTIQIFHNVLSIASSLTPLR